MAKKKEGGKIMKRSYSVAIILVIALILLGIFAIASAQKPAQAQTSEANIVKIGLPMPLSGPASPWGLIPTPFREAWIEVFNREGFDVAGKNYKLKLIQVDDQNSSEGGAAAAKQLIYGDGCKFFAGHWSWNFPAVAAVTNPAKVIFVTRTGNQALPKSWGGLYDPKTMPYVVFGSPSEEIFIANVFALVKKFPESKQLGMLDCTLGAGAGWDQVFDVLKKAGIKYHMERFPLGTTDFAPYITRFREAGCKVVYIAGWVGETMQFAKQRWEMGYKDMVVGSSGPFVNIDMYNTVCGHDAAQGLIGQYWAPWDYKKTKVNPKYIAMCKEALKIAAQKTGKPYEYTGEIGWVPSHTLILVQAMQKAGTVTDTDAIMKAIRGGTFDTTAGKWTMSGAKTYGSPVVFGSPSALCEIKGDKEVYLTEDPTPLLP